MDNDEFEKLKQRVRELEDSFKGHSHEGTRSQLISVQDLYDTIETITVAPTNKPRFFWEQVKILNNAGVFSLYIYDMDTNAWKRVTLT